MKRIDAGSMVLGAKAYGLSNVHFATWEGTPVCVQFVPLDCTSRVETIRFATELGEAAKFRHPGIARALAWGASSAHQAFVVVPHMDVGHLRAIPGAQTWPRARATIASLLDALAALHTAGRAHGHLEPEAVFLRTGPHGIRTQISPMPHGVSFQNNTFRAPEWFHDGAMRDHRQDLYSVGRICEEMLARRRDEEVNSYPAEVAAALDRWIGRMIAVDPDHRYQNAFRALEEFMKLKVDRPSRTVSLTVPVFEQLTLPDGEIAEVHAAAERALADRGPIAMTFDENYTGARNTLLLLDQRYRAAIWFMEDYEGSPSLGVRPTWVPDMPDHRLGTMMRPENASRIHALIWRYPSRVRESFVHACATKDIPMVSLHVCASVDVEWPSKPAEVATLNALAVAGPQATPNEIEAFLTALGIADYHAHIETLGTAGFLRIRHQHRLHPVFAEMATRAMAPDEWQRYNRIAFGVLSGQSDTSSPFHVRLARHAGAAGLIHQATEHALLAASGFLDSGRNAEARQIAEYALAIIRDHSDAPEHARYHLWLRLGQSLVETDPNAAIWWLERAAEPITDRWLDNVVIPAVAELVPLYRSAMRPIPRTWLQSVAMKIQVNNTSVDPRAGLAIAGELLLGGHLRLAESVLSRVSAQRVPDRLRPTAMLIEAKIRLYEGDDVAAVSLALNAASLAERLTDLPTARRSHIVAAHVCCRRSTFDEAAPHFTRAAAIAARSGDDPALAAFLTGILDASRGATGNARANFDHCAKVAPNARGKMMVAVGDLWLELLAGRTRDLPGKLAAIRELTTPTTHCEDLVATGLLEHAGSRLEKNAPMLARDCWMLAAGIAAAAGDVRRASVLRRRTITSGDASPPSPEEA